MRKLTNKSHRLELGESPAILDISPTLRPAVCGEIFYGFHGVSQGFVFFYPAQ